MRKCSTPDYNYVFDTEDGRFVRWGATLLDDPQMSVIGPEIADIEISTDGCSAGCPWCYKSNKAGVGKNMSFDTYKKVLGHLNMVLQVALGITDADANPDFIKILEYTRSFGIVPNYTTSGFGLTKKIMDATAELCGAVAVSLYPHNYDKAIEAINAFIDRGMKQVNIHLLYYEGNQNFVKEVIQTSSLIDGINAVVLLGLKPKGRGDTMRPMDYNNFSKLVDFSTGLDTKMGFDSCSAKKFEQWAKDAGKEELLVFSEPCESSLFSIYVNAEGMAFPCSFGEGMVDPVSMLDAQDFIVDVWNSPEFVGFREMLLQVGRRCPLYVI